MTKTEFLQQLDNCLYSLPFADRQEIIQDFEEHFAAGLEQGKTEEQICSELGNPQSCAAPYITASVTSGANQVPTGTSAQINKPYGSTAQKIPIQPPYVPTNTQEDVNARRNKMLWSLVFIFFVICAFGVYPTALALMASPIAILLVAIFAAAFVPSGLMIALMISLAIALFTAGLLTFLIMTALLKFSFRRSSF
jgi:hypothetical protein